VNIFVFDKTSRLRNVAIIFCLFFTFNVLASDVLVMGDSMMKSVAREFKKDCEKKGLSVESFSSIGSGLARLDLLDWYSNAKELVEEHKPSIVLVMMGANDNQAMQGAGSTVDFGLPGWEFEYGRRCGKLMDIMLDGGVSKVVWFGLPCMREKKLNADVKAISRIIKQQALARPKVSYISTYKMFSKKLKYSSYIIQKSGMPLDVRASDGIHLNRNGAKYLVDSVAENIFVK
jgi:hypothetical protein